MLGVLCRCRVPARHGALTKHSGHTGFSHCGTCRPPAAFFCCRCCYCCCLPLLLQADQQVALLPHFSKEERCMKVAFERVRGHA